MNLHNVLANLKTNHIVSIAGAGYSTGVPAKEADIGWPMGVVRRPDGDLLLADIRAHRVWRIDREGILHIFAGDGYSAGYYSYFWADALTADAAEAFEQSPGGYYDAATAQSLYDNVLSVGDTVDPAEAFRTFRGRDVDTGALLRKRGFAD